MIPGPIEKCVSSVDTIINDFMDAYTQFMNGYYASATYDMFDAMTYFYSAITGCYAASSILGPLKDWITRNSDPTALANKAWQITTSVTSMKRVYQYASDIKAAYRAGDYKTMGFQTGQLIKFLTN